MCAAQDSKKKSLSSGFNSDMEKPQKSSTCSYKKKKKMEQPENQQPFLDPSEN